jgi:hypothetical protein
MTERDNGESMMNTEVGRSLAVDGRSCPAAAGHGPSIDFIRAISEFLDTDPEDLLVELGYYEVDSDSPSSRS